MTIQEARALIYQRAEGVMRFMKDLDCEQRFAVLNVALDLNEYEKGFEPREAAKRFQSELGNLGIDKVFKMIGGSVATREDFEKDQQKQKSGLSEDELKEIIGEEKE